VIKASYPYGGTVVVATRFHRGPHKFHALKPYYFRGARTHFMRHRSRTFCPTQERRNPMKTLILAAFAALSLTTAIAPAANAFVRGVPHTAYHSGPYDPSFPPRLKITR